MEFEAFINGIEVLPPLDLDALAFVRDDGLHTQRRNRNRDAEEKGS
ncbi:hypothetical protein [Pseudarthrobacter sp. NPDC058119]